MEQSYEKIIIELDWSEEIFGLMVTTLCNNELIVFCDCGSNQKKHLKLHFGVVEAFLVHGEFCHPDMGRLNSECPPSLSNAKFYPLLKVKQSQWKESFTEYRSLGGKSIYEHYQVLSTSNILDVLSNSPPIISWVSQRKNGVKRRMKRMGSSLSMPHYSSIRIGGIERREGQRQDQ